jgi:tripartite motif-containing protein 71
VRQIGRTAKGRARWLVVFISLLLVASSAPVVASSSPDESAESGEIFAPSEVDPALLPDGGDLKDATAGIESEEAEREDELATPWAEAEREESRLIYRHADSAEEASELLLSTFGSELKSLDLDPMRFLSDVTLKRGFPGGGAVVSSEGQSQIVEAGLPAKAMDEGGDMSKVNLDLEATSEGFVQANPLVDLEMSRSAAEGIEIEGSEIRITQVGADPESSARPFGDKDVLYPNVQTDTDLLVVPLSSGVELFDQLRSIESPEILRFDLDLPAGAEMRANAGAVEIYEGERLSAIVSPPHAVDAQGTLVPVAMEVQGSSLVLTIGHRAGEYAYPILVDPELQYTQNDWVNSSWIAGNNYHVLEDGTFGTWWNNGNLKTSRWCIYACWGSGRGLFVSAPSGSYPGNQQAHWIYTVPGETGFLNGYLINPFYRHDHNCGAGKYPEPHDFDGLWSPFYQIFYYLYTNRAPYTNASVYGNTAATAKVMVFGLNTGNSSNNPCWRDIYAGGIATYMTDPENPTLDPISGYPTGWFDDSKTYGVSVSAHDPGLGVANVQMNIDGKPSIKLNKNDCYGTHGSPCPRDMWGTIPFDGKAFEQGKSLAKVVANDALLKPSGTRSWTAYVDLTPPEVSLSGQLAVATKEEQGDVQDPEKWDDLSLPVYNLKIEAEDGSKASDKTMRSGVKDIEIFLDEKKEPELVPWKPQGCSGPSYSCEMEVTYQLKLHGLAAGKHTLKVFAVDQLGHKRERHIEFEYIPATGMKDGYVMHYFPLPDGKGNEAEEEHPRRPELAVNVMNGNLVYREEDVDIEGYGADLEVERYYNSQLPTAENTEWGDGWTLAQTPSLEPEEGATPSEAEIVDSSGGLNEGVALPEKVGEEEFDPELQATIAKEADGGYEMTDETGESPGSIAFNEDGRAEALRTEGYAKVDYAYEGGELTEIEVQDPSTFSADPEELEIPSPELIAKPTFAGSFGKNGSADGQLKSPADVAFDSQGNLWVVDKANNRIQKFSPDGKFLLKFGTLGSGNGQLSAPAALAIDAQGNIWVADGGNRRVQKFNSKGEYLAKFGSQGTGNGQFSTYGPRGITIDAAGNLWVSDYSGRVQKFNASGEFVKAVGTKGSGPGQFGESAGLDAGGGKVWVGDWTNHRVSVFSEAGEFLFSFGSYGSGNGQLNHPDTVEVDAQGNVWVGDQSNHRIQQFDSEAKYVRQFGSYGTSDGQFSLAYPFGIETDGKGRLWVADPNNHRVQEWLMPITQPAYVASFGSKGSADGQLSSPADVAVGAGGALWVADRANNRIQKFDSSGKFLFKFGTAGSGEGQFSSPASIAVDRDGNLLVLDRGNHRVQRFDPEGNFIDQFGSIGEGDGELWAPEAITTDFAGNVWVCDTGNGRIQRFDEEGEFVETVGSLGSGEGEFGRCAGIDVDPDGRIWAGDWAYNRVNVFDSEGEFLFEFGSSGSGDGQFNHPDAIEVDHKGNVFVGDQSNHRVQVFDSEGNYLRKFGSYGAGAGQFNFTYPLGLETDSKGNLWVADVNNHRIQHWLTAHYAPAVSEPIDLTDGDPGVQIESEAGLITSVEGNAAGEHSYQHEGELLVSHNGPDGETSYDYDEAGRMTKVTLPNGSWGQIAYHADGRVKSVTVAPEGASAKVTYFSYSDEPRSTTITPEGESAVHYNIGADGSVLKWQNVKSPPVFDAIYGSLYFNEGKEAPPGAHVLDVQAHSEEGIASIQVVLNGTVLADEETCEEDLETPEVECKTVLNEWVMETENFVPGVLTIEVIIEDRLGEMAAERFWVNIPPPPPPPPAGAPTRPKFSEIQNFREEFGLDIVDPVSNEMERNARIFNLINAWTEGDPVARASRERWGVPLRPADIAEMEYRESYIARNGSVIPEWAETNYPLTYAGYYVDHRAGGIIRVGFTAEQSTRMQELEQVPELLAVDRFTTFAEAPSHSYSTLESLQVTIGGSDASFPPLRNQVTSVGIDVIHNNVTVGALDANTVATFLNTTYGSQAPIDTYHDPDPPTPHSAATRWTDEGPLRAGQFIGWYNEKLNTRPRCTAGFGAAEPSGTSKNGHPLMRQFVLTAGHCFTKGFVVRRFHSSNDTDPNRLGIVSRRTYDHEQDGFFTDGEAIRLESDRVRGIVGAKIEPIPVKGVAVAKSGTVVCISGAATDQIMPCETITRPAEIQPRRELPNGGSEGPFYIVRTELHTEEGDSGAPVWSPGTRDAIGIHRAGGSSVEQFIPLLPPPMSEKGQLPNEVIKRTKAPGLLFAPGMGTIHIVTDN